MSAEYKRTQRIGFIGLGAMGSPMAANLARSGFLVAGFDLDADACAALAQAGGTAAASAVEAAREATILVVMVPDARATEAALFDDGALHALPGGAIVVLMATCLPADVVEIADRVLASGRRFVDAPVSGGVVGARAANLTIMAAGTSEDLDAVRPVFQALGERIFVVGEKAGQGAVAKAVNQLLCGVHIAAAAEAFSLAERLGLDLEAMLEIVSESSASSWMIKDRGPRMLRVPGEVTSAVDIFCKDLGIVLDTGREAKAALPLSAAAYQMFLAASGRGEGRLDDSQVIRSWRIVGGGNGDPLGSRRGDE
jgi:L-threonate 2-dehydrogenase